MEHMKPSITNSVEFSSVGLNLKYGERMIKKCAAAMTKVVQPKDKFRLAVRGCK